MEAITQQGHLLKIKVARIKTRYWRPGTDVIEEIVSALKGRIKDGDIVAISEKALATGMGAVIDESSIKPGSLAKAIASFWMPKIWGGPLGKLVRLKTKTLCNLRNYPLIFGSKHKQMTLTTVGFLQTLKHYSEGGIDASNLPYSYVSLPLPQADKVAHMIREHLSSYEHKIDVMIVDGDSTYSWRNLHLSPRHVEVKGLVHFGGFITFVIGRIFNLRARPTPIAFAGGSINPDLALWLARIAHKVSGPGAGRTVWGMSNRLNTDLIGVTYEMLERYEHAPIVVLRIERDSEKIFFLKIRSP